MSKNRVSIILVVVMSSIDVFASDCYTTDLAALRTGKIQNGKHQVQNCEEYMKGILRLRGISNAKLPPNIDFHCFTLTVDKGTEDVVVKGCVPPYGCGLMKNIVTSMMKNGNRGQFHQVQCNECVGKGCNKPRFFEKSSLASSNLLDY